MKVFHGKAPSQPPYRRQRVVHDVQLDAGMKPYRSAVPAGRKEVEVGHVAVVDAAATNRGWERQAPRVAPTWPCRPIAILPDGKWTADVCQDRSNRRCSSWVLISRTQRELDLVDLPELRCKLADHRA